MERNPFKIAVIGGSVSGVATVAAVYHQFASFATLHGAPTGRSVTVKVYESDPQYQHGGVAWRGDLPPQMLFNLPPVLANIYPTHRGFSDDKKHSQPFLPFVEWCRAVMDSHAANGAITDAETEECILESMSEADVKALLPHLMSVTRSGGIINPAYPPRSLYCWYLRYALHSMAEGADAISEATDCDSPQLRIECISAQVVAVQRQESSSTTTAEEKSKQEKEGGAPLKLVLEHKARHHSKQSVSESFNAVVLCVGRVGPPSRWFLHPFSVTNKEMLEQVVRERFFASPWLASREGQEDGEGDRANRESPLNCIPANSSVFLIGTGLTAVDVAKHLLLRESPVQTVTMLSRNGLLPSIACDHRCSGRHQWPLYTLQCVRTERIDGIVQEMGGAQSKGLLDCFIALIAEELAVAQSSCKEVTNDSNQTERDGLNKEEEEWSSFFLHRRWGTHPQNGLQLLRCLLRRYNHCEREEWQNCIIMMVADHHIRYMWSLLQREEQQLFMQRYNTVLQVFFNPMPASSARDVLQLVDSGRLHVYGGLLECGVQENGKGFYALTKGSGGVAEDKERMEAQYVIDCTGLPLHFDNDKSPRLLRQMVRERLLHPHLCGGFEGNYTSCKAEVRNEQEKGLDSDEDTLVYLTGHSMRGTHLLTSGLSHCCDHAYRSVADIFERIRRDCI